MKLILEGDLGTRDEPAVQPSEYVVERLPQVTISHPSGTFYADAIHLTVAGDGTRHLQATGNTRLEVPMGEIMGGPT
jgi:hypothetical protein